MALISCPACDKQVSRKAPTCPQCGHPIATEEAAREQRPKRSEFGGFRGWLNKPRKKWTWAGLVGVMIIVAVVRLGAGVALKGVDQKPEQNAKDAFERMTDAEKKEHIRKVFKEKAEREAKEAWNRLTDAEKEQAQKAVERAKRDN